MLMVLTIITLAMPGHHKDALANKKNSYRYLFTTLGSRDTIVDKMPCLRAYALGGLEPPALWLRGESTLHYTILPYFGKRKQVTYHPNLSYWCFHISPNVLFFQAKFYAETLILLRYMLGKTSWYSIDVSGLTDAFCSFTRIVTCFLLPK